jgi:hypothetical protein
VEEAFGAALGVLVGVLLDGFLLIVFKVLLIL